MSKGKFDRQLGILPWDAMMLEVRRSAYRVAWIDERIEAIIERQDNARTEILGDGSEVGYAGAEVLHAALDEELRRWLGESRNERAHLARVARECVQAGITQSVVDRVALETHTLAMVLGAALDALQLEDEARDRATDAFRAAIAAAATERREDVLTGRAFEPVRMERYWTQFGSTAYRQVTNGGEDA